MKIFEVNGEYKEKKDWKKFKKNVKAESNSFAAEKTMCVIGSKHKVKRRSIQINEVKEVGEKDGGKKD